MGMLNVQITDSDLAKRLKDEQTARGHKSMARTAQMLIAERLHQIELARLVPSMNDGTRPRPE